MSCHIVGVRPHNFAHRITVNSNCEIFGYYLAEFAVIDQVRQIWTGRCLGLRCVIRSRIFVQPVHKRGQFGIQIFSIFLNFYRDKIHIHPLRDFLWFFCLFFGDVRFRQIIVYQERVLELITFEFMDCYEQQVVGAFVRREIIWNSDWIPELAVKFILRLDFDNYSAFFPSLADGLLVGSQIGWVQDNDISLINARCNFFKSELKCFAYIVWQSPCEEHAIIDLIFKVIFNWPVFCLYFRKIVPVACGR